MLRIPFYKPSLGQAEINEVLDTLQSGWLTTGPKTKQFEREFAEYMNQEHAVAVNSCTAALHLALEAIGITADDAVLVPTMTFAATAEVVRYLGANPILVDCRESDFNLDIADAEMRLQAALHQGLRVAAIMPVHYAGQIGDMAGITELASRYQLKIVEDAAHCCPAFYRSDKVLAPPPNGAPPIAFPARDLAHASIAGDGEAWAVDRENENPGCWLPAGAEADISCFSFYANKCITTGEGGMACTGNAAYADRMRIMSLHGISRDAWKRYTAEGSWYYEITAPGYKYNLTDIASSIGLHQLRRAKDLHTKRSNLARLYQEKLGDIDELVLPVEMPDRFHSWHLFVLRLRLDQLASLSRVEFIAGLHEAGIGTSVHYLPLHMHPYYRDKFGYRPEDLPCMAQIYPEIVTLPIYPDLTEGDVEYVCDCIRQLLGRHLQRHQVSLSSEHVTGEMPYAER
jgi:perosamine synthetase